MGIFFTLFLVITPCTGIYLWIRAGKNDQKNEIFLNKYSVLIGLLSNRRNAQITKVRGATISVEVKFRKDVHQLTLTEFNERLEVTWKLESPIYGKSTREWSFNPAFSQSRMYGELLSDIRTHQYNLLREKKMRGICALTTA